MRKWVFAGLAVGFFISSAAPWSSAEQPGAPIASESQPPAAAAPAASDGGSARLRHPWGRFSPGAWSLVRVVNETFDENGAVASTGMTETNTTLLKVEDDGVTLRFETSAWVSGKQIDAKPQVVKQCYHGGLCSKNVEVAQRPPVKIQVDGREIECKVESVNITEGDLRTAIRTYYNDTVSPFVFKRESETVNQTNKTVLNELMIQVDAVNMPCEILDQIRSAAHLRVTQKHTSGAVTTTLAYMSPEIPGGTIQHSSKQVDQKGRIISRSILELMDFGLEPSQKRVGLLQRRAKSRRYARRTTECPPE